jgi:hypothetical protein
MAESFAKPSSKKCQVEVLHTRWRCIMMATGRCSSRAAGLASPRIMICIKGSFFLFNYHYGIAKFDVKIFDGTQCEKKYEAEVYFHKYQLSSM